MHHADETHLLARCIVLVFLGPQYCRLVMITPGFLAVALAYFSFRELKHIADNTAHCLSHCQNF